MRNIARVLCAAVCLALLLSGCAAQNINELLRAPALGEGQGEVQQALKDYLNNEEVQYKFPKEGEWRSPLVMLDLTGDGVQEGVLFYTALTSGAADSDISNNVHIAILEQTAGVWSVVRDEVGLSTDVASVEVTNMFGNGTSQLVVGYGNATMSDKQLAMYYFSPEENAYASQKRDGSYVGYQVGDFAGNGQEELAVVSLLEKDQGSVLVLDFLTGRNGTFEYMETQKQVELYSGFTSFIGLYASGDSQGGRHLVVDGRTGAGVIVSQILNFSESNQAFYARDNVAELAAATVRYSSLLTARDINNDGAVEIPAEAEDKITTVSNDKNLKFVEWNNFFSEEPQRSQHGILDVDRSIFLRLPDSWNFSEIRIEDGEDTGLWKIVNPRTGEVLLEIRPLQTGELPPGENKQIPDSDNLYAVPKLSMDSTEKAQITVTFLA